MKIKLFSMALLYIATAFTASAKPFEARPAIYVNQDVTTHILMPENIKLVDISTDKIVGDQCADNMLRVKPIIPDSLLQNRLVPENTFLGAVTLIGERHIAQYDLLYTPSPGKAETLLKITYGETDNYVNPDVPMSEGEMANYAWAISNSGRNFNMIRAKKFGIEAQVYNIYSIGSFFFVDLNLKNNTNIRYDIAQMRVTLSDKKLTKATNTQSIELTPAYVLNKETSFKRNYRQVIVLPKLTYPEEKVLNIEISEDQISGRVISIPIQYEDILNADCFDGNKEKAYANTRLLNAQLNKEVQMLQKKVKNQQKELDSANVKIKELNGTIKKKSNQYITIRKELEAMLKLTERLSVLKDDLGISLAESNELPDDNAAQNNLVSLEDL